MAQMVWKYAGRDGSRQNLVLSCHEPRTIQKALSCPWDCVLL
jgi:hypothetical protein